MAIGQVDMTEMLDEQPLAVKRRSAFAWMKRRYQERLSKDNRLTNIAAGSVAWFGTAAMSVAALGMPTGFGAWPDQLLFLAANGLAMLLAGYGLTVLFSFLVVPLPRRLLSVSCYVGGQTYLIIYFSDLGIVPSLIIAGAYTLTGVITGLCLGRLLISRTSAARKAAVAGLVAIGAACAIMLSGFPQPAVQPEREAPSADPGDEAAVAAIPAAKIKLDDPSMPGSYEVVTFSYGSGKDKHRKRFGEDADIVSEEVDASGYITSWSNLKTAFWGFDEHDLPLNGRVWLPEGEGKFPLVLMVHGNHLMEDFSDGGYGYLGELLASRGMIAVSVDSNFLNYSVWSSLPNDDMKMRAWLMLKHLQFLQGLDQKAGNAFTGKVDWQSVALIGHSRGGQAVAMAADAGRWFKKDDTLGSLEYLRIRSVIAIAPTDKRVDDKSARLTDVNYLTLQGAMDADVNNFYGDRQYNRVSFNGGEALFKAELYLSNANHSQFNTEWGRMDERLPGGLFLNLDGLMKAEDQRQIAKTYISAFLEATLHGREQYEALFQDYRSGSDWLPATTRYVNRYESSAMLEVENYEHANSLVKETSTRRMEAKKEASKDRGGNDRGTDGMLLEWQEPDAAITLALRQDASDRLRDYAGGSLLFSLANSEWKLLESESGTGTSKRLPPLPDVELILNDRSGGVWSLMLNDVAPLQPPSYASFMSMGWLERKAKDRKYKEPAEAVFQSFVIPMERFRSEDGGSAHLLPENIISISFHFRTARGRIMLDDIGFMKQGGTYVEYQSSP
ncbi:alpha/beta hydrolase [Paenibacillus sp. LHD-117]|uniref:alpha/beta hydrolase n=1 Tax=Paenibacillus sp. LHD-117 TaxID=3071412 RepID=UPI0027E0F2D3|nr:alpha/beta hydrolase [Paenibacillus sp. LHD-117]MDQ6421094.1 alpha/beta hydrolase [Paenibacillus sp. LHD-117]